MPFERTLFERVDVADEEDPEEGQHAAKNQVGVFDQHIAIDGSPWVEEDHFNIEEDEKHCHKVEADSHSGYAGALRQGAALVSRVLDFRTSTEFAEQDGESEHSAGETQREQHQHKNWYVLAYLA